MATKIMDFTPSLPFYQDRLGIINKSKMITICISKNYQSTLDAFKCHPHSHLHQCWGVLKKKVRFETWVRFGRLVRFGGKFFVTDPRVNAISEKSKVFFIFSHSGLFIFKAPCHLMLQPKVYSGLRGGQRTGKRAWQF